VCGAFNANAPEEPATETTTANPIAQTQDSFIQLISSQ
jgi:hypothetical protein